MKFEEVIPAYRKGKRIRRKSWNEYKIMKISLGASGTRLGKQPREGLFWRLIVDSLLKADDWVILKEPKKVKLRDLTLNQFHSWKMKNCHNDKCEDCVFNNVNCLKYDNSCWVKNKDIYNDKFLDQEIEVEDYE